MTLARDAPFGPAGASDPCGFASARSAWSARARRDSESSVTAEEIRRVEFAESWRGYSPPAVDAVLDQVARQLDEGERLDSLGLARLQFPSQFRGYKRSQVDEVIERLREENC